MKMALIVMLSIITFSTPEEKVLKKVIQTATDFITLVDESDAVNLAKILHPEMVQFAKIGDKLMPFKGKDFLQMVADKKIGGTPRKITLKNVQIVREGMVDIIIQAVSDEYDFMYQISLAKEADKWLIVTVMTELSPVK